MTVTSNSAITRSDPFRVLKQLYEEDRSGRGTPEQASRELTGGASGGPAAAPQPYERTAWQAQTRWSSRQQVLDTLPQRSSLAALDLAARAPHERPYAPAGFAPPASSAQAPAPDASPHVEPDTAERQRLRAHRDWTGAVTVVGPQVPPEGVARGDLIRLAERMASTYRECLALPNPGRKADYIQALARQPSSAAMTLFLDTMALQIGEPQRRTVQSVSKILNAVIAAERIGLQAFADEVGAASSDRRFNESVTLGNRVDASAIAHADAHKIAGDVNAYHRAIAGSGDARPVNACYNIGATRVAGLMGDNDILSIARFRELFQALADAGPGAEPPQLAIDWDVFTSEWKDCPGNYMFSLEAIRQRRPDLSPGEAVEAACEALMTYITNCSWATDARSMGAAFHTLFNGGRNPRTGVQVIAPEIAAEAVRQMKAGGFYEVTPELLDRFGLIGKSGVGGHSAMRIQAPDPHGTGTVSATLAGVSEELDPHGNSFLVQQFAERILRTPEWRIVASQIEARQRLDAEASAVQQTAARHVVV